VKLAWYVNNCARPAAEEEDHLPPARLPRRDHRHGEPHRARLRPYRLRPADCPDPHTECPYHYRGARPGESEEAFAGAPRRRARAADPARRPDTVAAFFAEPVMAAGGVIVPPATYSSASSRCCASTTSCSSCDEVVCGFGRTGNMFGSQTFDLKPDIVTVAKALSAGYLPISANLVSERSTTRCSRRATGWASSATATRTRRTRCPRRWPSRR